ncbi:MAG TPA: cyclic nucleotide-binding domain-containing protein [Spirochaetes bacterium]|nr:cyclic nucleotide-binding domain-containing protein [Spirochaetota bacterium]
MPGKLRSYKTGSVIYFLGDVGDNIYILKSGVVSLVYYSIETGEEVRDNIKTGEFFGVKSALSKRPREETALAIKDATALVLTNEEFEHLIIKNVQIITNFLRVFSNQLRKLGKIVRGFLDHDAAGDNEAELFKIGEYYLKNHKYNQAQYVYTTYLKHYSSGNYTSQARERLTGIKDALEGKGPGTYTSIIQEKGDAGAGVGSLNEEMEAKDEIDLTTKYYDAISLFSQEKYKEAYSLFKTLLDSGSASGSFEEYLSKIQFEMGRCLIALKKYQESIMAFTSMIKNYPKDENVKDALYYIGIVHKLQGDKEKAVSFFTKVINMPPESQVDRKARKELSELNG